MKKGMAEGGREGRMERTNERSPFIHIYMLHILRNINLPKTSFCPKFSVWEEKQYVTV